MASVDFTVTHERRPLRALFTLLALLLFQDWSGPTVWQVWGMTADGRRFLLREFGEEGTATYTAQAFAGQLELEPSGSAWAASKGFDELARHLAAIEGREGPGP